MLFRVIHKYLNLNTMTDSQENKRSMGMAVMAVLDANNAIWSASAGANTIVTNLRNTITLIDTNAVIQAGNTTQITAAKTEARTLLTSIAIKVAKGGFAYANVNGNTALAGQFDYERTDIVNARDTIVMDITQIILDAAHANDAAIADFGVTAADITELDSSRTTYGGLIAAPSNAINTRATATATLVDLFKTMMDVLNNQMDAIMVTYKDSEPAFYQQYTESRKIIDLGRRSSEDGEEGGGEE